MLVIRALLLAGCLTAPLGAAAAAGSPPATAGAAPAGPPVVASTSLPHAPAGADEDVDTSALAYYARAGDQVRVEAEIRRLRVLHPGWEPPPNLGRPARDWQPLWDLFGADRLDELEAELARIGREEPGAAPPPDLLAAFAAKAARRKAVAAATARDWQGVVEAVAAVAGFREAPGRDVDLAWRLAEAEARLGRPRLAADVLRALLGSAIGDAERVATARKAVALLPAAEQDGILALARPQPGGADEFAAARLDRIRAAVGAHLSREAPPPDEAALARLAAEARTGGEPGDLALLGWLALARGRAAEAEDWFRVALERGAGTARPDPDLVVGRMTALVRLGRRDEARALAEGPAGQAEVVAEFGVDIAAGDLAAAKPGTVPASRIDALGRTIRRLQSPAGAAALGWYHYRSRQGAEAVAWFDRVLDWRPDAKAVEGRLRAGLLVGDAKGADRLADTWRERFPEVFAMIEKEAAPRRTARPAGPRLDQSRPTECLEAAAKLRAAPGPAASGAGMQEGWCLLALGRDAEAASRFAARDGLTGEARGDAAYGEAIARLRRGETAAAVAAASDPAVGAARRAEIGILALTRAAEAAARAEDWRGVLAALDRRLLHAPEDRPLAVLRAWALHGLGRRDEAHALFRRLDAALSTRETRSGLAWTDPLGARDR